MKRSLSKILLISIVMALLCVAFAICASAAESYTLTYFHEDTAKNKEIYSEGEEITLRNTKYSNSSNTFYGWFSDDGRLFAPGEKITIDRDTNVYEACGKVVNNENDLLNEFRAGYWTYVKLGKDMSITKQLSAANSWTVHILDLNGHTLNISGTQYGTGAQRNGVIFTGQGTINFSSNNPNDGAFCETSRHGYGDGTQRLWIGRNVKVVSNVPLFRVTNDMTPNPELPTIRLWGDITCKYLVRSTGLSNVDVNIYPTAKITITGTDYPLLRDLQYDDIRIMNLKIHGGTFSFPDGFKGFVPEENADCYSVTINGGTFNIDISKYISVDYKTVENSDGTWSVEPNICPSELSPDSRHKYLATAITVSCEADGDITYKCDYCKDEYTAHRFALGHNVITMKKSDLVNTAEKTTPGMYTHTCARCGSVEEEYFFPDPANVYVTVKARYERDGVKYVDTFRTKSSNLFGFQVDDETEIETATYLTSFGFTKFTHTFDGNREVSFKQSEIVAVEIPLGTTRIYGGYQNGNYKGLFFKNEYLEEVYLPQSLRIVEKGAFAEMPKLKVVTGVEYISDTIDEYAFGQSKTSANLTFDTLELSAKNIKASAFKNVLATRIYIHDSVRNLNDAFRLDNEIATAESAYDNNRGRLKEIFVEALSNKYSLEANPNFYDRSLSQILNSLTDDDKKQIFAEVSSGSALLTKANVFYDHKYDIVIHAPTCIADGYTAYECLQCGLSTKSDFVPHEGITHVWERNEAYDKEPTCSKEGYKVEYCQICESTQIIETIPRNNKHNFADSEPEPDFDACESTTFYYRRRCANGCGTWSENKQQKVTLDAPMGHKFPEEGGVVKVPATCGQPGKTTKTCERCGKEDSVEIPATGVHSFIRDDNARVAPTCAAPGMNYFNCSVCGAVDQKEIGQLTYDEAVEKNAHVWKEEIIIQPTKTSYGVKRVYCSLCTEAKRGANTAVPKLTGDESLPVWAIILIVVGGVALLAGVGITIYFTLFKKNNASKNYKYKFNTFKR